MSAKPADFFVGIMDFFAILLPGSILTFLLIPTSFGNKVTASTIWTFLKPIDGNVPALWIVFFVASYVLGHLLHHMGGYLDDWVYDKCFVIYRKNRQVEGEKKKNRPAQGEMTKDVKEEDQKLLSKAKQIIKNKMLRGSHDMTSTFSWAAGYVRTHNSVAGKELDRGGADSKFFRSLAFVAFFATIIFLYKGLPYEPASPQEIYFPWIISLNAIPIIIIYFIGKIFPSDTKEVYGYRRKMFFCLFNVLRITMSILFFVIFFAILILPFKVPGQTVIPPLISILVFYFSLWRYCDLRWKNCQLTYEYFIMLAERE